MCVKFMLLKFGGIYAFAILLNIVTLPSTEVLPSDILTIITECLPTPSPTQMCLGGSLNFFKGLCWEDQLNPSTCDWYSSYSTVHGACLLPPT